MKNVKQKLLLKLLTLGLYKIDAKNGIIYCKGKNGTGIWKPKIPTTTKDGYIQYHLVHNKKRISVYAQNLFYINENGQYPENKVIDHRNNIKSDNKISNLNCISHKENLKKSRTKKPISKGCKRIMGNKLKQIFKLYKEGFNQSQIASVLKLHRLSVRYHINKFENKEQFRYINC